MHEASLAADLVRHMEKLAQAQRFTRVVAVRVEADVWYCGSAEHLKEHFALIAAGTVAEGACLQVETTAEAGKIGEMGLVLEGLEVEG